jgi:hypothetical protein
MVKLEGVELGGLYRRRPETGQEVHKLGKPLEVWLLNDNDSMEQVRAIGKGTFLLQARIERQDESVGEYLILSKIGKSVSWELEHKPFVLPVGEENYIRIRKDKVGRKKRELSEPEREKVRELRGQGMSINAIATRLHVGNRLIMQEIGGGTDE